MNTPSNRAIQLVFIFSALCLWPFLHAYVNNPDSFQYIGLARHWSEGRWAEAVNGYWSPLLSWLLAPLLLTAVHPVLLFKGLQLFIAMAALGFWSQLVNFLLPSSRFNTWIRLSAIPLLLSQALLTLTADLLFVTGSLGMLCFFLQRPVWSERRRSLKAGALGGLLYFAKAFGFPLFLAFSLTTFLHHRKTVASSGSFKNFAAGISMFLLLAGTWSACISVKYGHLTLSEAAAYNATRQVAGAPGEIVQLPILYDEGLTAPFGKHALSAWEEPMQSRPLDQLQPFISDTDTEEWLGNIKRNFLSIWYFDFRRQAGVFFLLIVLLSLLTGQLPSWREQRFFYPVVLLISVYLGYGLILYHARYSWLCNYMMLLTGAYLAANAGRRSARNLMSAITIVLMLVSVKRPVKEILFGEDKAVTTAQLADALVHPASTLRDSYSEDNRLFQAAEKIPCLKGSFASRFSGYSFRPRYFSSLMFAERSGQRYFGQINDQREGALQELKDSDVEFLLVWDDSTTTCFGKPPVCVAEGVRVFRIP